jgi:hypothetical protein
MGWLTLFLILQGIRYYEQKQFANTHEMNKEENEEDEIVGHLIIDDEIPIIEYDKMLTRCAETISDSLILNEDETEGEGDASGLKDQLINELNRRVHTENSIYETGKRLRKRYFSSCRWYLIFWSTKFTLTVWHGHSANKIVYDCLAKLIAAPNKSMMQSLRLRDPISGIIVSVESSRQYGKFSSTVSVTIIHMFTRSQDTTKLCD